MVVGGVIHPATLFRVPRVKSSKMGSRGRLSGGENPAREFAVSLFVFPLLELIHGSNKRKVKKRNTKSNSQKAWIIKSEEGRRELSS